MVVENLISGPWVCGRVSGPVLVTFPLMRRGSAAAGGSLVNIICKSRQCNQEVKEGMSTKTYHSRGFMLGNNYIGYLAPSHKLRQVRCWLPRRTISLWLATKEKRRLRWCRDRYGDLPSTNGNRGNRAVGLMFFVSPKSTVIHQRLRSCMEHAEVHLL